MARPTIGAERGRGPVFVRSGSAGIAGASGFQDQEPAPWDHAAFGGRADSRWGWSGAKRSLR